jgi:hypothetical protein
LTDSDLELEDCTLRDLDGEGVHATGGRTRIRGALAERTNEAFSIDEGDTVVEYCVVRDAVGDSDLIDCNRSSDPPARIAYNVLYNTTDDGIDADGGAVFAEGNIIHDCADQAISLVGAGSSTVIGNLCYRNGNGLSVKDAHVVFASFNTFALNTVTGVRAIEKTPGRRGGIITLTSSIVWGNAVELLTEANGVIDATFCDVLKGFFVLGEVAPALTHYNLYRRGNVDGNESLDLPVTPHRPPRTGGSGWDSAPSLRSRSATTRTRRPGSPRAPSRGAGDRGASARATCRPGSGGTSAA